MKPTEPPVRFDEPPLWFREVRLAAETRLALLTVTAAPEPDVIFVVPPLTVTLPAETVTFARLIAVISEPADETLPLTEPPVRLAVPPLTFTLASEALAVNVLLLTRV